MFSGAVNRIKSCKASIAIFEGTKIVRDTVISMAYYFMRVFPIKENKVIIDNFQGRGYGDNGKYIAEALLNDQADVDIVWLCEDINETMPSGIRKKKFLSIGSIYEQCTAKFWIDNRRKPGYVRKRKGQIYINTWHAGIALKRIEKDAINSLTNYYVRCAKNDSKMVDYFLSDSNWTSELYKDVFWYSGKIMKVGLPRQDIVVNHDLKLKTGIKQKLGIDKDIKIVLYAPTFRSGSESTQLSYYNLDWNRILAALVKRFGGKWVGIIRLHPNIADLSDKLTHHDNVIDGTKYPDMQELLVAADCVISDYSSTVIDFCPSGNLGFIFATDIDEYQKDRNFYFNIRELPFPIGETNEELEEKILTFDHDKYEKDINSFYHEKCGLYPLGHAARDVAKYIVEHID